MPTVSEASSLRLPVMASGGGARTFFGYRECNEKRSEFGEQKTRFCWQIGGIWTRYRATKARRDFGASVFRFSTFEDSSESNRRVRKDAKILTADRPSPGLLDTDSFDTSSANPHEWGPGKTKSKSRKQRFGHDPRIARRGIRVAGLYRRDQGVIQRREKLKRRSFLTRQ